MSHSRHFVLSLAAGLLVFVLPLAGCGRGAATTPGGTDDRTFEAGADRPAPPIDLAAVDGSRFDLGEAAGQVLLIDFWATWCAPCREEVPMFKELHETYGDRGFSIVAISDESAAVIKKFVDEHDIPYPNLVDAEGDVSVSYGVLALPSAYLVDRQGRIVEYFVGPKPRSVLEKKIRAVLDDEDDPST